MTRWLALLLLLCCLAAGAQAVAPVANFSANVTSGTVPLLVDFVSTSTDATGWAWDLDHDGTVDATSETVVYSYAVPGVYTVALNVSNAEGTDTEVRIDYITAVAPAAPVADFTANVSIGPAPLSVQFTDQSSNAPVAWAWDLNGDGTTDSAEQDPACAYPAPGLYTVSLNCSNAGGFDAETKVGYINVTGGIEPPAATLAAQDFVTLAETHGTTWIQWTWPAVNLSANASVVGTLDGAPVLDATANTTPFPAMYYAGDLNPNEYHVFSLLLVNNSTGTPSVETTTLGVTTAQGSEYFYLLFVVVIALALVGAVIHNRYMAAVLLMFSFLVAAYLAVGLTAANPSFAVIAIMTAVVTGLGMVYVVYDIVKSHVGWENDDY